jgi:hypothetical protein
MFLFFHDSICAMCFLHQQTILHMRKRFIFPLSGPFAEFGFHHVFPILSVILTKYHYIILTDYPGIQFHICISRNFSLDTFYCLKIRDKIYFKNISLRVNKLEVMTMRIMKAPLYWHILSDILWNSNVTQDKVTLNIGNGQWEKTLVLNIAEILLDFKQSINQSINQSIRENKNGTTTNIPTKLGWFH